MIRPFYLPSLGREASQPPLQHDVEVVTDLLASGTINDLATAGDLTLAMIRPSLADCVLVDGLTDLEAADEIEARIQNLGMITKFAIEFDEEAVEEFYSGVPKQVQLELPPERFTSQFVNRWEEFKSLMLSGKSTAILLHSPESDAIKLWRDQVGHYDVVNKRDESNIRGQLALDNYNNLIHGSDSPESVVRELGLLADLIKRTN